VDYREKTFRAKFGNAACRLGVKRDQIVSLKLRDNIGSYQEYRDLVDRLRTEAGLQCSEIDADLQGRGYLISDDRSKLILVEHETGLEILYIAGSIASLIQLVPMVLRGWHAVRGRRQRRPDPPMHDIEIRRMDSTGRLLEEHIHDHPSGHLISDDVLHPSPTIIAGLIEGEMKNLTQRLESLTSRVEYLEKRISPAVKQVKKKAAKRAKNATQKR
jgi:hypothetical protein